jgi:hypothetical protein
MSGIKIDTAEIKKKLDAQRAADAERMSKPIEELPTFEFEEAGDTFIGKIESVENVAAGTNKKGVAFKAFTVAKVLETTTGAKYNLYFPAELKRMWEKQEIEPGKPFVLNTQYAICYEGKMPSKKNAGQTYHHFTVTPV